MPTCVSISAQSSTGQMITALLDAYAYLLGRPWLARFNKGLVLAGLRGLGFLNHKDFGISGEKGFAERVLKTYQERRRSHDESRPPIIFDVGANIGNWTIMMDSLLHGHAYTLYAFEPSADTFSSLSRRTNHNSKIAVYNLGLSNASGIAQLHDYAESGSGTSHASLEKDIISTIHGKEERCLDVSVETGDSFCRSHQIEFVDFLKIDVEGHELKVLMGFKEMISTKSVGAIQFEFNETMIPSRTFMEDFRAILCGYTLFRILPKGRLLPIRRKDLDIFRYQNIAAIIDGHNRPANAIR